MNLKLFTKANDWGEETGVVLLDGEDLAVTNSQREKRACIDEYDHDFRGDGLGFVISNTNVFYFKEGSGGETFVNYPINADGSLGESFEESFTEGNLDSSFNSDSVIKPTGFGAYTKSDEFDSVAAVSAAETKSPKELVNSGAIAFYTRINDAWDLKGEVYGEENNDKLGLYKVEFEDEHDLIVTSNNYFVDYVSDVLVSSALRTLIYFFPSLFSLLTLVIKSYLSKKE